MTHTPKKDESVKTGLEIEGNNEERDLDELVHQQPNNSPDELKETDPDEQVHQQPLAGNEDSETTDPDESVHQAGK